MFAPRRWLSVSHWILGVNIGAVVKPKTTGLCLAA
jgi:hypothetical protein